LLTLTSVVGQLAAGAFGDRYSKRMIAAVAMLGHAAAMFLLSFSDASPAIVAAAIVHGLAWGARGPLMTAIRAEYYGRRNFAKIMGTSSLIVQLGTVIGPLFAGYVFDQTGSYQLAFLTLGSLTGASSIFFVLARRPALPQRLRAAAEARELT
jgi:MFS family permease